MLFPLILLPQVSRRVCRIEQRMFKEVERVGIIKVRQRGQMTLVTGFNRKGPWKHPNAYLRPVTNQES